MPARGDLPIPNHLLKTAREKRRWSQDYVAEQIHASARSVSRWELGHSRPYPYFCHALCRLFDMEEHELGLNSINVMTQEEDWQSLLPALPSDVIGRADDLAAICRYLLADESVALTGLPGVGKTTLAQMLAHDQTLAAHFTDGVLFGELGPHGNISKIINTWNTALEVSIKSSTSEKSLALLRTAIGEKALLLILDDVWDEQTALTLLAITGPRCSWMITSRFHKVAAALAGKQHTYMLAEFTMHQGMQYMGHIAPNALALEPQGVENIVREVGGVPLALRVIGRSLEQEAASGQVRRLQMAFEHLHEAREKIHAAIAASAEYALNEEARAALSALAVLPAKPGSFSEEAAIVVADCDIELFDRLYDFGFLEVAGPARYRMHQVIADYATSRLDKAALAQAHARLIAYSSEYLFAHEQEYRVLVGESAMILAALGAAQIQDQPTHFIQMILLFAPCMLAQGWLQLAEGHLKYAYEAATALDDHAQVIKVLLYLGRAHHQQGFHHHARDLWHEALNLARKLQDEQAICELLSLLCWSLFWHGAYQELSPFLEEGLPLALLIGHHQSLSCFLRIRAYLEMDLGHYAEGEKYLLQGLPLVRAQRNVMELPLYYLGLATRRSKQGDYVQASEFVLQGLEAAREAEDSLATCLLYLFRVTMEATSRPRASLRDDLERARALAQDMGDLGTRCQVFKAWSNLELALHEWQEAEKRAREGLECETHVGALNLRGELLSCLAQVALARGQVVEADAYLQGAWPLVRKRSSAEEQGRTLVVKGELLLMQQHLKEAKATFQEIFDAMPAEHVELAALAHYGLARVAAATGKAQEAKTQGEIAALLFARIGHYRTQEVHTWLQARTPLFRRVYTTLRRSRFRKPTPDAPRSSEG